MIATKRGSALPISDEQYRKILEWKKLKDLAKEFGISAKIADQIRRGVVFKHR